MKQEDKKSTRVENIRVYERVSIEYPTPNRKGKTMESEKKITVHTMSIVISSERVNYYIVIDYIQGVNKLYALTKCFLTFVVIIHV